VPPDRKFSAASLKIAAELEFEASWMQAQREVKRQNAN
jgi:hypothetical protein